METVETYNSSFKHLCDVVSKRIICDKEVLRFTSLKQIFVRAAKKENLDASSYKTSRLKLRLKDHFPELIFVSPRKKYESDIVMTGL